MYVCLFLPQLLLLLLVGFFLYLSFVSFISLGVLFLHASSYSFFSDFLVLFAVFMASLVIFCFLFAFILIDPTVDSSDFMIAFSSVLYVLSEGVVLSHMFFSSLL